MNWTIDRVDFHDVKDTPGFFMYCLPDGFIGVAHGMTADGRVFISEIFLSRELWDDKGREFCEAIVRDSAHPPNVSPPEEGDPHP